jgi:phasin family protein
MLRRNIASVTQWQISLCRARQRDYTTYVAVRHKWHDQSYDKPNNDQPNDKGNTMTSLPEQFSAARLTQLDNGFNLMRSFSDEAFERTSRVFALQFEASRNAVEQSTSAMRQLLEVRDPRDLLAFGTQSQQNLRTLFDYSRALFGIATGTGGTPLRSYSVDALNAIATANAAAAQQTVEAAVASITPDVPVAKVESQADTEAISAPAIEVVTSDIEPDAAPTAIAKATSEALDLSLVQHPVAASVPVEVSVEIELPKVEPVDAAPPVATPQATTKVTEIRGTKGRRKQN